MATRVQLWLIVIFVSVAVVPGERCFLPMFCNESPSWVEVSSNNVETMLKSHYEDKLRELDKKVRDLSDETNKLKTLWEEYKRIAALPRTTAASSNTSSSQFTEDSTSVIQPTTKRPAITSAVAMAAALPIATEPKTCNVQPSDRIDCGAGGISKKDCESKGCCYDNSIKDVVWCFDKA